MGGVPHIDRNTGAQISVKNIVLEYVPTTYGTQDDGKPKPETDYHLIGSGQAVVFTDGGQLRPPGARPQTVPPHSFSTPPANPSR
jgi:Protein of unknown function (DUF3048) C-terminal domain